MGIWSNELAYNLFGNYEDWYQNFINETTVEPSEELKQEAKLYFEDEKVPKTMTNEQAAKILQGWLEISEENEKGGKIGYIEGWFTKRDRQAFEMAIHSLLRDDEWKKKNKKSSKPETDYPIDPNGIEMGML